MIGEDDVHAAYATINAADESPDRELSKAVGDLVGMDADTIMHMVVHGVEALGVLSPSSFALGALVGVIAHLSAEGRLPAEQTLAEASSPLTDEEIKKLLDGPGHQPA